MKLKKALKNDVPSHVIPCNCNLIIIPWCVLTIHIYSFTKHLRQISVELSDRGRWWPHGRSSNLVAKGKETQRQHEAPCGGKAGEAQNTTNSDGTGEAREAGGFLSILSWQYTAWGMRGIGECSPWLARSSKECKEKNNKRQSNEYRTKFLTTRINSQRTWPKWMVTYRLWRFSHEFDHPKSTPDYFSLPQILSVTQRFDQGFWTAYCSRFRS